MVRNSIEKILLFNQIRNVCLVAFFLHISFLIRRKYYCSGIRIMKKCYITYMIKYLHGKRTIIRLVHKNLHNRICSPQKINRANAHAVFIQTNSQNNS